MSKIRVEYAIQGADIDPTGSIRRLMYFTYAMKKFWRLRCHTDRLLKKEHLNRLEGSTLFILGSGASVCELGDSDFAHINDHVSIGVNTWPLHPFVPDFYAFEHFRSPGKKVDRISEALMRDKVLNKKPYFLIKDSVFSATFDKCVRIPEKLQERALYYTSLPILTRDVSLLKRAYRDLMYLQNMGWIPHYCTADRGASIIRLASLGIASGFKNIVFVGVDLNNTQYFWQEDKEIVKRWTTDELVSGQTGKIHKTNDPSEKRFTVTEVLQAMDEVARADYGVSMWTASAKSALTNFMDVYNFTRSTSND